MDRDDEPAVLGMDERVPESETVQGAARPETFGGVVEVRWEEDPGVRMHGGLAYFVEFLKVSVCDL